MNKSRRFYLVLACKQENISQPFCKQLPFPIRGRMTTRYNAFSKTPNDVFDGKDFSM